MEIPEDQQEKIVALCPCRYSCGYNEGNPISSIGQCPWALQYSQSVLPSVGAMWYVDASEINSCPAGHYDAKSSHYMAWTKEYCKM